MDGLQIHDFYRRLLLEGIVPFWWKHGVDGEYGGVLSSMEEDGTAISGDKYIWSQGRWAWVCAALYNRIGSPVMTDLKVEFKFDGAKPEQGPAVTRTYPADAHDLFAGEQLVVVGRYKQFGAGKVFISGKVGAEERKFDFPVNLNEVTHAFFERTAALEGGDLGAAMKAVVESNGADAKAAATLAQTPALMELQAENERLMQRVGLEPEGRKFMPHVTLARLRDSSSRQVADYLATHPFLAPRISNSSPAPLPEIKLPDSE